MNIENFKGAFNDLARPNRFEIILSRGGNLQFFAKATTVPNISTPAMDANYQGRIIKLPGDRENPDWTITVYGSTSYDIYRAFRQWHFDQNDPVSNTGGPPTSIKEDGLIKHLGRDGAVLNTWKIVGCFPTDLGSLPLDWGSNNTPLEFEVTLAFDYWLPA